MADLQVLLDRVEIRELTARCNLAFDEADADGFAATFTPDGVFEVVGGPGRDLRASGADELKPLVPGERGQVVHMTTDAVVDVDGDVARQRCNLLLFRRTRSKAQVILLTARYDDELARTPDGWRFVRRSATVDYAHEGRFPLAGG